jgi:hypothetical protein
MWICSGSNTTICLSLVSPSNVSIIAPSLLFSNARFLSAVGSCIVTTLLL